MKFDPEAKRFLYVFLILALFSAMTTSTVGYILCGFFFFMAIFSLYFFRDPERKIPDDPRAIVAPADGIIVTLSTAEMPDLGRCHRIGIFMNIHDVHVNRSPIEATVKALDYREGDFKHAGTEQAFESNERMIIDLESDDLSIRVVQIAGMVARRIVCRLKADQKLSRGERIGVIRFGSRVEVFIPEDKAEISSKKGDRVVCGESVIAKRI